MSERSTAPITPSYRPRPIRFLRIASLNGWRVKVYGISAVRDRPDPAFVEAAEQFAQGRLPNPPIWSATPGAGPTVSEDRYGVACVIVHEAREGGFVLVSWWVGENMLQHRVFFSPDETPRKFEDLAPSGIVACVWELAVLSFERQAWVDTVLNNPAGPSLDDYMARQYSADV